jgi:hypothetical protein
MLPSFEDSGSWDLRNNGLAEQLLSGALLRDGWSALTTVTQTPFCSQQCRHLK